jgi:hypothetical protein
VAGDRPELFDAVAQHVGVAVKTHLNESLHISRFFAFAPEFGARTRPIDSATFRDCRLDRLGISPSHHEKLAGLRVLRNDGDEPVLAKAKLIDK